MFIMVSKYVEKYKLGDQPRGIGVVTNIYVNPELNCYWVINYRIYDPAGAGQSKITHMLEMIDDV